MNRLVTWLIDKAIEETEHERSALMVEIHRGDPVPTLPVEAIAWETARPVTLPARHAEPGDVGALARVTLLDDLLVALRVARARAE